MATRSHSRPDVKELAWCTVIYVPYMERYFIHEDECTQCDTDWNQSHLYHFDMWAGGDAASRTKPERGALHGCESTWTRANGPGDPNDPTIVVNPTPNLPVATTPIFSPPTSCWQPISLHQPAKEVSTIGQSVSLQFAATDTSPGQTLTYTASGLPTGLSIDRISGRITGIPTTRQRVSVTVTASDALDSASVRFRWQVRLPPRR